MSDAKAPSRDGVLEKLRAEHGQIVHCVTPKDPRNPAVSEKLIAFRGPNQDEYEDWQEGMKKARMGPAWRSLCLRTRLLPETEEALVAIFQRWPGLATRLGDAITDIGGADIEVSVKKD